MIVTQRDRNEALCRLEDHFWLSKDNDHVLEESIVRFIHINHWDDLVDISPGLVADLVIRNFAKWKEWER